MSWPVFSVLNTYTEGGAVGKGRLHVFPSLWLRILPPTVNDRHLVTLNWS